MFVLSGSTESKHAQVRAGRRTAGRHQLVHLSSLHPSLQLAPLYVLLQPVAQVLRNGAPGNGSNWSGRRAGSNGLRDSASGQAPSQACRTWPAVRGGGSCMACTYVPLMHVPLLAASCLAASYPTAGRNTHSPGGSKPCAAPSPGCACWAGSWRRPPPAAARRGAERGLMSTGGHQAGRWPSRGKHEPR